MKICPNCKKVYYGEDYYCIKCNYRLINYSEEERKKNQKILNQSQPIQTNTPKCPTCGSTQIKKISATSKVFGAAMFGLFSKTAKSQFCCKNCGYKW